MAGKTATVYVLDLGASTGECHNGRTESDLDYGMRYVWDKIAENMLANRATLSVGVVGFRTDETKNSMADDDPEYQNISMLKELGQMQMPDLNALREQIKPSETNDGDAISAIIIAIDMITEFTTLKSGKPGKYGRKIVLLTDGEGHISDEDIGTITEKMNEVEIELLVVGVDFDDLEYGFKEEDKSSVKRKNEKILKDLSEKCTNATFATAAETIEALAIPRLKESRPYAPYKGRLSLGNFEKYPETALYIDVVRYFRTKSAKPPSATSYVTRAGANGSATQQSSHTLLGDRDTDAGDLSEVRTKRYYGINDPTSLDGKKPVDPEELAKGYEYGRTVVPVSPGDRDTVDFQTVESFDIVGFIPSNKYEKYMSMGESCITVPMAANDKAKIALSSFVRALYELESYAVARIVTKAGKAPEMLLLAPSVEQNLEALIDVPLPFAEDVRVYRFPPLDRVITTSGATLTKHRSLPSDELDAAMSAYVDSMDLSTFEKDEDGEPAEYMAIEDTYSPMVHRVNQAIRNRAVKPNEPITSPAEILIKYSNPPSELVSNSAPLLEKLIKAADVKKVPPKVKGKRYREQIKPMSGLDIEAILGREKRQKITKDNSIAEFKQMLAASEDEDTTFKEAAKQLGSIIREHIKTSTGDSKYDRALENIRVMREEMIGFELPTVYNDFLADLKKQLLSDELGGGRNDFMFALKQGHLGLIDSTEADSSKILKSDAAQFFVEAGIPDRSKAA